LADTPHQLGRVEVTMIRWQSCNSVTCFLLFLAYSVYFITTITGSYQLQKNKFKLMPGSKDTRMPLQLASSERASGTAFWHNIAHNMSVGIDFIQACIYQ
jgi:hypothetical protein